MKDKKMDTLKGKHAVSLSAAASNVRQDANHLHKPTALALSQPVMIPDACDASGEPAIRLHHYEQGVFRISCCASEDSLDRIYLDIKESIQRIDQDSDVSAVLLMDWDYGFLSQISTPGTVLKICHALLDCKVPLIAAMDGVVGTFGIVMGLCSDIMVLSQDSRYRYQSQDMAPVLNQEQQTALLARRFGFEFAEQWVRRGFDGLGKDIKSQGVTTQILPPSDIAAAMEALVTPILKMEKKALQLLKQHLCKDVQTILGRYAGSTTDDDKHRLGKNEALTLSVMDSLSVKHPSIEDRSLESYGPFTSVAVDSDVISLKYNDQGVLLVEMCDRQNKNMFSDSFVHGMTEVSEHIKENDQYKVVVLTGYDEYFACGGTLEGLVAIYEGKKKFTDTKLYYWAMECDIPVIAAMQGHGIGAGWSMGMFCDFVIFSEESTYVSNYMRYGFTPGAGATLVLPEKLYDDFGREILFTAKAYKGRDLEARAIPYPVLKRKKVLPHAMGIAEQLALSSREQLCLEKKHHIEPLRKRLDRFIDQEAQMHDLTFVGNKRVFEKIRRGFDKGLYDAPAPVARPENATRGSTASQTSNPVGITDREHVSKIRQTLIPMLANELLMEAHEVDSEANFSDLGIDSIAGLGWVKKINAHYGFKIGATKLYNYPTISEFSDYVLREGKKRGLFYNQVISVTAPASAKDPSLPAPQKPGLKNKTFRRSRTLLQKTRQLPTHAAKQVDRSFEGIAIVGMSGKFPKSEDVAQFWQAIANKVDCITEVPASRWNMRKHFDPDPQAPGKSYSKWMGVMDGVGHFDPLFFNISPKEAELMDPQQRLFLEQSWACLENAGYSPEALSGTPCGVFVGCRSSDYGRQSGHIDANVMMGSSASILSSRIAYVLNLQGPCLAIDTACSSSLVAIAEACNSLVLGNSDMALAGGVSIQTGPSLLIGTSKAGMLSKDGKCFTFDQRANGFVAGEGVGVLALKRLSDAQKDHDHIHGIICGWGVNQDGKTNGITAPNQDSQCRLQKQVYGKFGIDPESITLVEAHGTGTSLGDPIEVEALTEAFRANTDKKNYCALGSIKSNIGHLMEAAGVAGVIKVLLAQKHKMLPPTLNFKTPNPHINLDKSPFYINTQLQPWTSDGHHPRRAAVSSFGWSGTNAHVVIEAYRDPERHHASVAVDSNDPVIIVLSAKNEARLKVQAKQLLAAVKERKYSENNLVDMAYTLQVGRQAMTARLAMVVRSVEALEKKCAQYIKGSTTAEDLFCGVVKGNDDGLAIFSGDEELLETIRKWIERRKYDRLADLWVRGGIVDWRQLYGNRKPFRISLPTYPFEKQHYWVPESDDPVSEDGKQGSYLHPLVHQNTSNFYRQRFSSTFTGSEFFLADHVINEQPVLPGVAYLEMVIAAVMQARGAGEQVGAVGIKNLVWITPVTVQEKPAQVHIDLLPRDNGALDWRIYSRNENQDTPEIVHSEGVAGPSADGNAPGLDIAGIKAECDRLEIGADRCYEAFKTMGMDYGPAHQGIEKLYVGEDKVLAKLCLPAEAQDPTAIYVLNPALMDAALQSAIGLASGFAGLGPMVPFALQSVDILGKMRPTMWAYTRYTDGAEQNQSLKTLDIDICDDKGHVCVRFKGFAARVMAAGIDASGPSIGQLMLHPVWKEQAVDQQNVAPCEVARHLVLLVEPNDPDVRIIEDGMHAADCFKLASNEKGLSDRFCTYATQVFEHIQGILKTRPRANVLIQVVVFGHKEQLSFAGLGSLLRTAELENPQIIGQLIEVRPGLNAEAVVTLLKQNSAVPTDHRIRYKKHKRYVAHWHEHDVAKVSLELDAAPWKEKGVYLMSGGAGRLGLLMAREIVRQTRDTVLILTGRSDLNAECNKDKQDQLKQLSDTGARIKYRQVDVTDFKAVEALIQGIRNDYGGLTGIVHIAGVISDNFILKKTIREFQDVLSPKVQGLVHLDRASKDQPLDFFILFSSMAAAFGNSGQSDYACANGFMDAYAGYREALVASGKRHGKTLSINWPLWKTGGMKVDKAGERWMLENTGMVPMDTATGLRALHLALASHPSRLMVMHGRVTSMRQYVISKRTKDVSLPDKERPAMAPDMLREKAQKILKQLLSSIVKLPAHQIEADAPLEKYGIDSIMVMALTRQLEKTFGSLPKTLFFEYQNLEELTDYFIEAYPRQLAALLESVPPEASIKAPAIAVGEQVAAADHHSKEAAPEPAHRFGNRFKASRTAITGPDSGGKNNRALDIAIIGLSGRYPKAQNVEQFWKNLKNGVDCITEIPKARWDAAAYYDQDPNKPGKMISKWGGFIDGVDQFDPLFFNISPHEAEMMDPQERIFLQCVYETLEDAGYTGQSRNRKNGSGVEGTVGVYVGAMYDEYQLHSVQDQIPGRTPAISGVPASIANRVSYYLNFNGPSMAVNTMCSSSLTAIHLACEGLSRGGCETAIAGGVNVSIHPNKYLMLSQGKFVSSKGRCESFGRGGDGYVPGEGVGAILLKPLSKAVAHGDHIYGVIKSTAINHGGKTNGYSVPNPKAQADVIANALRQAGISPRTISYLEAHGTGTSLGDPIEIAGLTRAFGQDRKDRQYCAIGSVKSNIGHCESAAGIAGVTKVLLQLKHKQIAPSLHSETLNSNIDFTQTPFEVQQKLAPWKRPLVQVNGREKTYPRLAGISSFGAGGANAHVVIEEYTVPAGANDQIAVIDNTAAIILLSAKNEERLKVQAQQLLAAVTGQKVNDGDLANMAYTLQVGREAMAVRLAIIVRTVKDLVEKLTGFITGRKHIDDLYHGRVQRNHASLGVFAADEDMRKTVDAWMVKNKYAKLVDLWIRGLTVDWNKLYEDKTATKPRRISLPTYPFEQQRYWIPGVEDKGAGVRNAQLHPLLHQNTSDLFEQRFSSFFTGHEFFLADHVVMGQPVLPAAAFLEMVRAAVALAAGKAAAGGHTIGLKNVVFASPLAVPPAEIDQPVEIHTGIYSRDNGELAWRIYRRSEASDAPDVVYSQGAAVLQAPGEITTLDIREIKAECDRQTLSPAQCYETFKSIGLDYGPAYQGIHKVFVGRDKVLARLSLPAADAQLDAPYGLHPAMIDSALQSTIGLAVDLNHGGRGFSDGPGFAGLRPMLPFALEKVEILGDLRPSMWAFIQQHPPGTWTGEGVQKLDIDLCDNQGRVCVRLKGYSTRQMDGQAESSADPTGQILLHPMWKAQAVSVQIPPIEYARHLVLLCGPDDSDGQQIKAGMKRADCFFLRAEESDPARRFEIYALKTFEHLQRIIKTHPKHPVLIQVVLFADDSPHIHFGLDGLLKTAGLENPKLIGQLIEVPHGQKPKSIIESLSENSLSPADHCIRYQQDKRFVAGLEEIEIDPHDAPIPWKDKGVYLITGGAGGLGWKMVQEIARQTKDATLIITGRSEFEPGLAPEFKKEKQNQLDKIAASGARIEYRQVDVNDHQAVTVLVHRIGKDFGTLNGIIHCAGVISDSFIIKKSIEAFQDVLAPKVKGVVNLDLASKDIALDFFIFFSSLAGAYGNPGQADYACGNAFMDAYAVHRNGLVTSGRRRGQTLSINWPLWKTGGMKLDKQGQAMILERTGMVVMDTENGMRAFYRALASNQSQVVVLHGRLGRMRQKLLHQKAVTVEAPDKNPADADPDLLRDKAEKYLKRLLSAVIKLPAHKIENDVPMETYGIDSVMVMKLTNQLENTFGSLSKTLFFEYQSIGELVGYFIGSHRRRMTELLKIDGPVHAPKKGSKLVAHTASQRTVYRFTPSRTVSVGHEFGEPGPQALDIAIVGLSGRYPKADNVQQFWQNLRDGIDGITEIPKDRWDHALYYDKDKNKPGKIYSKWGGFIDGVDRFDPLFFNISPREAERVDPQERLFLQCVHETIEDAGYTGQSLNRKNGSGVEGTVGVYVGVMYQEYQLYGAQEQIQGRPTALSGSPASIANRISYYFNFTGPSMAVDTMCSSSLTAIHLACESIRRGSCEAAIAGGVNVSIHPNKYLILSQGRFVSSKGRCESFGQGGDGYVPGEGVGAVLLKPLSKAMADGDHIYGVIKTTAINHGGKTNGYSVPNPKAQADVIGQALKQGGISPRAISYVEAHGTGTSLGDPIEIAGLTRTFGQNGKQLQYCAIGSVKSNIGHCESAAGIAGVTKVLLQLKHKQIAPSLHSETLNPNIDFTQSPFVVQQKLGPWKRPMVEIDGREEAYPRMAGISSFGAGGANAHVVIQEHVAPATGEAPITASADTSVIIVLSARNPERLKERVHQLLTAISELELSDDNLADMAYTLQVGRDAMEERLGLVTRSVESLVENLESYMNGQHDIDDLYHGQVQRNNDTIAAFAGDAELQEAIGKWIERRKYSKILGLWVQGLNVDWRRLYGEVKPHRISLPTYPFEQHRCWIPEVEGNGTCVRSAQLHPLLHQNISDFYRQRFRSTFTGREFFLSDHLINEEPVLPGAAYLEMAAAAVMLAQGAVAQGHTLRLKNVVWIRPMAVNGQHVRTDIDLLPQDNGEITWRVYSRSEDQNVHETVYSEGVAVFDEQGRAVPPLDIEGLKTECAGPRISSAQCYQAFTSMGMEYGPAHRGVETLYVGEEKVLARLSLPAGVQDTHATYVLHPVLMDAALQSCAGMIPGFADETSFAGLRPMLPFGLREVEIHKELTTSMWAFTRYADGAEKADKVQKLDIDICDDKGHVCVRIKGFSSRVLDDDAGADAPAVGQLMLRPVWKAQAVDKLATVPAYGQHLVLLCEADPSDADRVAAGMQTADCVILKAQDRRLGHRYETYAGQVFEHIQRIAAAKPRRPVLIQVVVFIQDEQQVYAGLDGLLKTAGLENPKLMGQLIEVAAETNPAAIVDLLTENSIVPVDQRIRYQKDKRYVTGWHEIEASQQPTTSPWKEKGVYLITGGAGGLGRLLAKEIASQAREAVLILTGRSKRDPVLEKEKQDALKQISASGARIEYKAVDVTEDDAVEALIRDVREEYGRINGIIHCAGIVADNFIIKKTLPEFRTVMAPKVRGAVCLDRASKDLPLDFFLLVSSIAGVTGNPGQADYACANAFMDAYAHYRAGLAAAGQRHGQTLSINWPLWKSGGMQLERPIEKRMLQSTGMVPMDTETGLNALYQIMASNQHQVAVMFGQPVRMRQRLFPERPANPTEIEENVSTIVPDHLRSKAEKYLKQLLSSVIKLPAHRIQSDAPMEEYGIDSVMVMDMTRELEKTFGSLSKTLFFEYQSIEALTAYFIESHRRQLTELLEIESPAVAIGEHANAPEKRSPEKRSKDAAPAPVQRFGNRFKPSRSTPDGHDSRENNNQALDIAIIGLSGRYPKARNVEQFWKNLRDGIDCITEIPKARWDFASYYDPDTHKPGRIYSKWGGFIEGVDQFDPLFFNISPREAEVMDPQERLFLQSVHEILEDAGYTRPALNSKKGFGIEGQVGVYVGVMYDEYPYYGVQEQIQGRSLAISGIPASIANRVSYYFNFSGPSMAVNTMCSSSLTAIHLACRSIRQNECDVAVAGGVNISIHPNKYLVLSQGKFVSSKGRCESFGQGGDGYVPGEGVGAVLLKPLSKAMADGDHIYGVVKSTAVNHGGKTNGYTVPNPNAQAGVIEHAYRQAGIGPRAISYVEAHGTGTSLGDPIEIAGLTRAFGQDCKERQYCAIGSVKSNIGHCESAAGIAAVTKVLLQLKHKQIAPSLHSATLNPNIDFSQTPFVVQQKLGPWKRPMVQVDGRERAYPRMAGISSFGAGGVNAHVVIQEHVDQAAVETPIAVSTDTPVIILLSARNKERLKERARQLLTAVSAAKHTDGNLADMAYTLQVGRDAMEERLALVVGSVEVLVEKLEGFINGHEHIDDLYLGQVQRNEDMLSVFSGDAELQQAVGRWMDRRKYGKIATLWVQGLIVDWNRLYGESRPRRISLPTYPFEQQRCWIPGVKSRKPLSDNGGGNGRLHPLLHQNTSDFYRQRFSTTLTGNEFFLSDHVIDGQSVLPGVAYLEMVTAAITQAHGAVQKERTVSLKNVVWVRPIAVNGQPVQIDIDLLPQDNGEIAWQIYTRSEDQNTPDTVHSEGVAVLGTKGNVPTLDIERLKAACDRHRFSAAQCYEAFKSFGMAYGPAHQGISTLYVGEEKVLAKLRLPTAAQDSQAAYMLHPSLMDAALQSVAGLAGGLMTAGPDVVDGSVLAGKTPALPFGLKEVAIFRALTPDLWALTRRAQGSKAGDATQKMDIDICDSQGNVCVRMKGFSTRKMKDDLVKVDDSIVHSPTVAHKATMDPLVGQVTLMPVWNQITIEKRQAHPVATDRIVIGGARSGLTDNVRKQYPNAQVLKIGPHEPIDAIAGELKRLGQIDHMIWVAPHRDDQIDADAIIDAQEEGVLQLFRIIKALLGLGYGDKELGWTVMTLQAQAVDSKTRVGCTHASVHGLVGAMAKEYAHWKVRLLDLPAQGRWPMAEIFMLPPDTRGDARLYRAPHWYHQQLIPVDSPACAQTACKQHGVYVVIGGAGGIGRAWSEYMVHTYQAKIVWIGRRKKDAQIEARLDALSALGPAPAYIRADATDEKDLSQACDKIKARYGRIDGLIHAAIVLNDGSLANIDEQHFRSSLAAKVDICVRLAQVFGRESLDFVLFFSSMQTFVKAPGQSNYAAGCTFNDAFAHRMSRTWPCPIKVMNWGYWGSVGVVASKAYRDRMALAGLGSIEPPEGMRALESLLSGPFDQLVFVKTTDSGPLQSMVSEEIVEVYPQTRDITIHDVEQTLSETLSHDPQLKHLSCETRPGTN